MVVCPFIMRITLDAKVIIDLEELTGKNLSKNGNELIVELIELAEAGQKPNSPCWVESSCSEQDEEKSP